MRLLLVHGTLADYRLGRLIKYSFYKNITFAFMFLFFQPFNGVSGQVCNFHFFTYRGHCLQDTLLATRLSYLASLRQCIVHIESCGTTVPHPFIAVPIRQGISHLRHACPIVVISMQTV